VTTAPDRDRTRPERAARGGMDKHDKTAWSKAVVLANAALIIVVAIVGFRYTQGGDDQEPTQAVEVPAVTSAPPPESTPSVEPSVEAPTPTPTQEPAPRVATTMRANFAAGDRWPYGAGGREIGSMAWPTGVVDGVLTHGKPTGAGAVSWLEKWTETDVRRIGARIRFAPNHSGAAILTSWQDSVLDTSGTDQPRTGMRLVATPGAWRLVALAGNGEEVLAQGTFAYDGGAAAFDLVRTRDTVWVTDPDGTVTQVQDPRIGNLSGPWASFELRESKRGDRPAAFREIWAG
jgi:hypothetical protein